jgi:hypothetical protein
MTRTLTLALGLCLLLASCGSGEPQPRQVAVSASGSVTATADIYVVRGSASLRGLDIAGLKTSVDKQVASILALGEDLDIAAEDITADSVSVAPEWQWQPEKRLLGYRVSRDVTIRVNSIDTYAELVTGLARLGVNDFGLAQREISDHAALEHQALARAMENARARAQVLADASDMTLGKVITVSEAGSPGVPMMRAMASAAPEQDSYQAGTSKVTARVSVTYELH